MPTLFQVVLGGIAVVLGVAWVIAPVKMSRLQVRVIYFGKAESPDEYSKTEKLAGRLTGALLAVLGALIFAGYLP